MKKYILYTLAFLSAFAVQSCKDDDMEAAPGTDRELMTMFINDTNRNKGDGYQYNCKAEGKHGNDIHLYWYGVNDCAGYEIRQALQPNVSGGTDAWNNADTTGLSTHYILPPDQLDLVIPDQQYSTDFRFSIRVLSKKDQNADGTFFSDAHASKWYGEGNGRQWQEYIGIQTADRYETPFAVYVDQSKTTKTTMKVMLNRNINDLGVTDEAKLKSYYENFNIDADGNLGYQVLTVEASPNNPNSTVGDKWKYYVLTEQDLANGYVEIDGLQQNSVYVINVVDTTVHVKWDAQYNTCSARSDGDPGPAIILKHDEMMPKAEPVSSDYESTSAYEDALACYKAAKEWDAARIDTVLTNFISDVNLAEGQKFYLEGGKKYFLWQNTNTCKGFVLETNPEDLAAGKGKAIVYMNNISMNGNDPRSMNFMFGRQPQAGEGGEIYMKMLKFKNIIWDAPYARNYGDNLAGKGSATGNYFINMYSNGMAVQLDTFEIANCEFKRMVRGFIREQGANYKIWNHVYITGNEFHDCGYYSQGGYPMIAGSGTNAASNLYRDMHVTDNTFYDSPFPSIFNETKLPGSGWTDSYGWNIELANNTFVNYNTRAAGNIFNMRNIPNNSRFTVKKNLFICCKQAGDERTLNSWGADIRNTMTDSEGNLGYCYLDFEDNYSTSATDDGTSILCFSLNPWTAQKNNFGQLLKNNVAELNGTLEVLDAGITPQDLMVSPCPPHKAPADINTAAAQYMHRCDALDGTGGEHGANLYFKNTSTVLTTKGIGAAKWRNGK